MVGRGERICNPRGPSVEFLGWEQRAGSVCGNQCSHGLLERLLCLPGGASVLRGADVVALGGVVLVEERLASNRRSASTGGCRVGWSSRVNRVMTSFHESLVVFLLVLDSLGVRQRWVL